MSRMASKATFSLCDRVLSDEWSRLKKDILEVLICLKGWKCAELRIQERVDSIMGEELLQIQA